MDDFINFYIYNQQYIWDNEHYFVYSPSTGAKSNVPKM